MLRRFIWINRVELELKIKEYDWAAISRCTLWTWILIRKCYLSIMRNICVFQWLFGTIFTEKILFVCIKVLREGRYVCKIFCCCNWAFFLLHMIFWSPSELIFRLNSNVPKNGMIPKTGIFPILGFWIYPKTGFWTIPKTGCRIYHWTDHWTDHLF